MNSAFPIRVVAILICISAATPELLSAKPTRRQTESPPNVVLIVSDDQAWNDFGFMGHPVIETPAIDQLASDSLVFSRGYVPSSLCCPSLATILTGLYPRQHGIVGNDPAIPDNWFEADTSGGIASRRQDPRVRCLRADWLSHFDQARTLPEILNAERGYLSMQTGKWWIGHHRLGGFTHGMTHGDPDRGGRHGDDGLAIGRQGWQPVHDFLDTAEQANRPFLLWYAPMMPHTPHNPPQRLLDKYLPLAPTEPIARYYAMCEWFDETVGELLQTLDERGLADDTIVIFVTDNGWINERDASRYAPRSKRSPNEGGIRTPIMVRWPGKVAPATEEQALASSVDIVPTILAAAGIDVDDIHGQHSPDGGDTSERKMLPGVNLLDAHQVSRRTSVFGEIFAHDVADIDRPESSLQYRWIIQDQWKLIDPAGDSDASEGPQLFNLLDDPWEENNLAATQPATVTALRDAIDASLAEHPSIVPLTDRNPKSDVSAAPPNIVFFLVDDQRNDALSCAGNAVVATPFIDRLAARGVRFENAFVTTSICAASRASILTGLWERTHGYTFGTPPLDKAFVEMSYPAQLRQNGYRTALIGKFGVRVGDGATESLFDEFTPLNQPYWKSDGVGGRRHLTDMTGDRAVDFLHRQDADAPFCLSVWFNAGHAQDANKQDPYPAPPEEAYLYESVTLPEPSVAMDYWLRLPTFLQASMNRERFFWRWDTPDKYQRNLRAYYQLLSTMDRNVGRVLRELKWTGLDQNTVVIFCSDNGYYQGSRGFAGKWTHFDESLRIPMIVFDPRQPVENRGRVAPEMVLNVDVPATILDLAGIEPVISTTSHSQNAARSLLPLVEGRSVGDWRQAFFCEHRFDHPEIPRWEGIRSEHHKYARYIDESEDAEFFYDLTADPNEMDNLVDRPDAWELLQEFRQRCQAESQALLPLPAESADEKAPLKD